MKTNQIKRKKNNTSNIKPNLRRKEKCLNKKNPDQRSGLK